MRLSTQAFFVRLCIVLENRRSSAQSAVEQLGTLPQWKEAQSAHRDGLSEITILRLNEIKQHAGLVPEAHLLIRYLLVESLVRAGRFEDALANAKGNELPFWRGLAHAQLGRLSEAETLLMQCATDTGHAAKEEAILTLSATLNQL